MPAKRKSDGLQNFTPWATLLTIRIDLQNEAFQPNFRCKPVRRDKRPEIRCSCPQIQLWESRNQPPHATDRFLLEYNSVCFVIYSSKGVEKAKWLCTEASRHIKTGNFISKVASLLSGLSKLCKGKKSEDKRRKTGDKGIQPFTTHGLDHESVSNELQRKINQPLTQSEVRDHGLGYIYIIRSQNFGTLAELKIGFSKYHPEHRAHELARCMLNPEVVGHTPRVPHAKRIESIVHTELTACRKVRFCIQCQRQHRELFTISHTDAREVVTRWSRWMLQQPYRNENAMAGIRFKNFGSEVIDNCPRENEEYSAAEEMGSYINTIWWDRTMRSVEGSSGLDIPHKNFDEARKSMRNFKRQRTGGIGFKQPTLDLGSEIFEGFESDSTSSRVAQHKIRPESLDERHFDRDEYVRESEELISYLKSIKTGCMSVSDPELGISESPLGDATMLPVIQLEELDYFDQQVKSWIGYSPTHAGFQWLQEAYQRGEWYGKTPRFKGIKAFRDYRRNAAAQGRVTNHKFPITSVNECPTPAPSWSTEPQSSPLGVHATNDSSPQSEECTSNNWGTVEYLGGSSGKKSQIRFRIPITPEVKKKVQEGLDLINNGGRAEVERRLKRLFAYYGVDQCAPDTDENTSSDDESDTYSQKEMGRTPTEIVKPRGQTPESPSVFSGHVLTKWFGSF